MKFGLDKCAIAHFVNCKLSGHNTGVKVGKTETIKGLEPGQVYGALWPSAWYMLWAMEVHKIVHSGSSHEVSLGKTPVAHTA